MCVCSERLGEFFHVDMTPKKDMIRRTVDAVLSMLATHHEYV